MTDRHIADSAAAHRITDSAAPNTSSGHHLNLPEEERPLLPSDAGSGPDAEELERLVGGAHHDPHSILGAHPDGDGVIVRSLRPDADAVEVLAEGNRYPLERIHPGGVFAGTVPRPLGDYRLEVSYGEKVTEVDDPYRWLPTVGEVDRHLISEGRHERLWDVLGAHVRRYGTPSGAVEGRIMIEYAIKKE